MAAKISYEQLTQLGVNTTPDHTTHYPNGPWQSAMIITIHTPAVSKSNHRYRTKNDNWHRYRIFETTIRDILTQTKPQNWPEPHPELPVNKRPAIIGTIWARTMLDAPNLPKSVYDAAETVLYHNDASVIAETSMISRHRTHQNMTLGFAALKNPPHLCGPETVHIHHQLTELVHRTAQKTNP